MLASQDKDLISKMNYTIMKFTDIIISIVALILAFYVIGFIFKLFWFLTILIIAYIIYIFLKKAF